MVAELLKGADRYPDLEAPHSRCSASSAGAQGRRSASAKVQGEILLCVADAGHYHPKPVPIEHTTPSPAPVFLAIIQRNDLPALFACELRPGSRSVIQEADKPPPSYEAPHSTWSAPAAALFRGGER